jgi:hypothetical protein
MRIFFCDTDPPHPQINPILTGKWANFKYIFQNGLPKLQIQLLRGWGRCLKATLQTRVPENFRSRRWGAERRVPRAQTWERGPPSA